MAPPPAPTRARAPGTRRHPRRRRRAALLAARGVSRKVSRSGRAAWARGASGRYGAPLRQTRVSDCIAWRVACAARGRYVGRSGPRSVALSLPCAVSRLLSRARVRPCFNAGRPWRRTWRPPVAHPTQFGYAKQRLQSCCVVLKLHSTRCRKAKRAEIAKC